jgi:hypothetical protein
VSQPAAGKYRYGTREFRVRYQLVAEMNTVGGGWTVLPAHLVKGLLDKIKTGEAVRDEEAT